MNYRVWKQLILLGTFSLVALWSIPRISHFIPPRESPHLDTDRVLESAFGTEPKMVVYGRDQIDPNANNILLMGASNVREGLKVDELTGVPRDWTIHSIAVGASNITQLRQIVHLLREFPLDQASGQNVVVLGLWYGLFIDSQRRWHGGDTEIEIEELRYGLYTRSEAGLTPVPPPWLLPESLKFIHHTLRITSLLADLKKPLTHLYWRAEHYTEPEPFNLHPGPEATDEAKRAEALERWNSNFGSNEPQLQMEQFVELKRLENEILALSPQTRLVIVDMPLPRWHQESSRFFRSYQERMRPILAENQANPRIGYINIQDLDDPFTFYDPAHPINQITPVWSARVGLALKELLTN